VEKIALVWKLFFFFCMVVESRRKASVGLETVKTRRLPCNWLVILTARHII
jgi:hypothetical protein